MALYRVNGKKIKGSRLARRERYNNHKREKVTKGGTAPLEGLQFQGNQRTDFRVS